VILYGSHDLRRDRFVSAPVAPETWDVIREPEVAILVLNNDLPSDHVAAASMHHLGPHPDKFVRQYSRICAR